jgi:hypothetical protein
MATVKKVGKFVKPTQSKKDDVFELDTSTTNEVGTNLLTLLKQSLRDIDFVEEGGYITILKNKEKIFYIEITQLPGCCGVYVLNNYSLRAGFERILVEFFDEFVSNSRHYGITFQITTAENVVCKMMESILSKCKNWTAVKKFKNANSGRIVTIWVSNND